jgi:hypothetical protein
VTARKDESTVFEVGEEPEIGLEEALARATGTDLLAFELHIKDKVWMPIVASQRGSTFESKLDSLIPKALGQGFNEVSRRHDERSHELIFRFTRSRLVQSQHRVMLRNGMGATPFPDARSNVAGAIAETPDGRGTKLRGKDGEAASPVFKSEG